MAAVAHPIPPAADNASTSSSDSASPTLASSPLASFSSVGNALPSSNSGPAINGTYRERQPSYDSEADVLDDEEQVSRRHSLDNGDDALKRYKEGLYYYTSARFDRFKHDLERKGGPNGIERRGSSQ